MANNHCCRFKLDEHSAFAMGLIVNQTESHWQVHPLELTTNATTFCADIRMQDVPLVVLNNCALVDLSKSVVLHPVYIVHEHFFLDSTIVYRQGMEDIFAIKWEYNKTNANGSAIFTCVNKESFPYSTMFTRVADGQGGGVNIDEMREDTNNWVETCFSWYKFRHSLADSFTNALK